MSDNIDAELINGEVRVLRQVEGIHTGRGTALAITADQRLASAQARVKNAISSDSR